MLARTAFFDFDMLRIREFLLGVCITFALWIPSMNEKLFSNNTQIQFHSLVALGNQYADTDNHCVEMANTRHRISLSSLADRTDFLRMVLESESSLTHRLYASRIECLHGDAKLEKVLKT